MAIALASVSKLQQLADRGTRLEGRVLASAEAPDQRSIQKIHLALSIKRNTGRRGSPLLPHGRVSRCYATTRCAYISFKAFGVPQKILISSGSYSYNAPRVGLLYAQLRITCMMTLRPL